MNTQTVTITRGELDFLLNMMKIESLPGLLEDPTYKQLTDGQDAVRWVEAERSLRLRGLALINQEGRLEIGSELLRMVFDCAFAQRSLILYCGQMGSQPKFASGSISFNDKVMHESPEPPFHLFQAVKSLEELVGMLMSFAGLTEVKPCEIRSMKLSDQDFVAVSQIHKAENSETAQTVLSAAGLAKDETDILLRVFGRGSEIVAAYAYALDNSGEVAKQSFNICVDQGLGAIVTTKSNDDEHTWNISPIDTEGVSEKFTRLLDGTINLDSK